MVWPFWDWILICSNLSPFCVGLGSIWTKSDQFNQFGPLLFSWSVNFGFPIQFSSILSHSDTCGLWLGVCTMCGSEAYVVCNKLDNVNVNKERETKGFICGEQCMWSRDMQIMQCKSELIYVQLKMFWKSESVIFAIDICDQCYLYCEGEILMVHLFQFNS